MYKKIRGILEKIRTSNDVCSSFLSFRIRFSPPILNKVAQRMPRIGSYSGKHKKNPEY